MSWVSGLVVKFHMVYFLVVKIRKIIGFVDCQTYGLLHKDISSDQFDLEKHQDSIPVLQLLIDQS